MNRIIFYLILIPLGILTLIFMLPICLVIIGIKIIIDIIMYVISIFKKKNYETQDTYYEKTIYQIKDKTKKRNTKVKDASWEEI